NALKEFPEFNASLDKTGENLIVKKYYHIGVAVDTPDGLLVPVIRDADRKGVFDLAKELAEISKAAREKKLKPDSMRGGSFSISSLGGIGGTAFTPIINAPEVAILGVARSQMRPVYRDGAFVPRLMLPLSDLGVFDLAKELAEISKAAREKKLKPDSMRGGSFSISSLGGIGGTAFTPIINAPEVAILGVARSQMRPVYRDGAFVPRLMLPLSLAYDH